MTKKSKGSPCRRKTLTVGTRKPKKQRRRGQSIVEGRVWPCMYCTKSYLSKNALVFHVRKKHAAESES